MDKLNEMPDEIWVVIVPDDGHTGEQIIDINLGRNEDCFPKSWGTPVKYTRAEPTCKKSLHVQSDCEGGG